MNLYLAHIAHPIVNLGPGRRIGLWVEGCSLGCPGCIAPELQTRHDRNCRRVGDIARQIETLAPGYDGITVSGGEPFEQAAALTELLSVVRRRTSLDVLVYSGYTRTEVKSGGAEMRDLLAQTDVLIDGRFYEDLPNSRLWRGSDNQQMHLLTPRSKKHQRWIDAQYGPARPVHFCMTADDRLLIVGIPERGFHAEFEGLAEARGVNLTRNPAL